MFSVVSHGGVAGRTVGTSTVSCGQAGKESVRPGGAAVSRRCPADGCPTAADDASGLKRGHQGCAKGQYMGLNFSSMLSRANGEWIRTDLRERDRRGILRKRDNWRDAKTNESETGEQTQSTAASRENSIHQNLSFETENELHSFFPEWQDTRGIQRCAAAVTVPMNIIAESSGLSM